VAQGHGGEVVLSISSGLITALLAPMLWAGPGLAQESRGQGPAAVAANPAAAARYYQRGLEHAKQGEEAQAVDDVKRAIELDPSRFEPYKTLDDLLSKQGDWNTIIVYWTKFLALQPNNAQAYPEQNTLYPAEAYKLAA
jgi:tetratricopeptide (TPR) repeat protein